jgi:two-component system, cell cycle response regulator DivK
MTHPSTSPTSPSVLIVDDSSDTRDMYDVALASAGFHVIQSTNGVDGLARAAEALPDVIVTDFSMPEVDGVELLVRVHADPRTQRIPVIVLSGWTDTNTSRLAMGAGAAAFLVKPCTPESLVREVRKAVAR